MMKKIFSYSLVLVSIIALSRCAGTEDNIVPPSDADTIITIAERMQVFEACKKKSAELNNLENLEDRVLFLAWLETQPAFYSVGFAGQDLYAIFQDGRVVLFLHTPLDDAPDSTGGRVSSGRASKPPANRIPQGRLEDLPKTKKVSLFNGMGKLFDPNCRDAIKEIFDQANAGYQVTSYNATIKNLKAVSDDAVFYIHTHGGAGLLQERYGPRSIMALSTKELATDELDLLYEEELDSERICYAFVTRDTWAKECHYAITSAFVREYMSFGENCFIYLDACNGFSEQIPGNETFRTRMLDATTNYSATIVGWNGSPTTYRETGQFVFDRLLAPYTATPGFIVSQEDPFQRPFDMAQVFDDMKEKGLGVSPGGAHLMYETTVHDDILLRPTIESMEIDEYTSTLTLTGLFPHEEGKVHVEGVGVPADKVVAWSPHQISCIIPETGNGSFGDVVVTSAAGIKSNTVPLTEWIIKLNYSADDNGIKFAGTCDLRLRADVHPRRQYIGDEPYKPNYPDHEHLFNVKGSSAVYTVSDRKFIACDVQNCFTQYTESPTPKVGRLNYTRENLGKPPFIATYNWGPEMKSITISHIAINADDIPLNIETRIKCGDEYDVVTPEEASYSPTFGFPTHEHVGSITLTIGDNYNISPGSWTKTINRHWSPYCSHIGSFKQTVQWDEVIAHKKPTKETAAREASDTTGN